MKERNFIRAWYTEKSGRLTTLSKRSGVSKSTIASKKSGLSDKVWNALLSAIMDITIDESNAVKSNKHAPYEVDDRIKEIALYLKSNPNLVVAFNKEIGVSNFVEKVNAGLVQFKDKHYECFVNFKNDNALTEAYNLLQTDKKEKLLELDAIYCDLFSAKKSSSIWSSQIYKLIYSTKDKANSEIKREKLARVIEQYKSNAK